nr:glycoside hydrolase family 3 N-terminal domain-containing protein [Anaerolinea sp.]
MVKRSHLNPFVSALILLAVMLGWIFPVGPGLAQTGGTDQTANQKARGMLAGMTAEERVGQLFMVGFSGDKVDDTTQIYDLIVKYHVGGVVLLRKNNNFTNQNDILTSTYQLTSALQQVEFTSSRDAGTTPVDAPHYIPLFIGISQEGDLYPNDQILSGVSSMPNLMAIGATWDPDLAKQVGQVMGSELSSLGFNLYLGPSLDVLDVLYVSGREDLGVRSFGGDPYWVGELGKAYVSGLHLGSNNHMAVIAKHFPGQGGSDRQPETEIATVRKTLDQLKQIELAPFFAVTNTSNTPDLTADGVLISHIRYQGFQGNIRQSTLPVSFDRAALNDILGLPELVPWRQNGGLLGSDHLGSPAIQRFFDPTGNRFDARLVARDAFLAGNDLLYADDFIASGDPDPATTMSRTLDFFTQKYREDSAFAQRVDSSVERILTLKYKLYPEFLP